MPEISLKTDLQVRPALKQILGLKQRLSLMYLGLPKAELLQMVQREVAENPFFDPAARSALREGKLDYLKKLVNRNSPLERTDSSDFAETEVLEGHDPFDYLAGENESLREHLLSQLEVTRLSQDLSSLCAALVDYIDKNGYLRTPMDEIAQNLEASLDDLLRALEALQKLDPPGIAARDLKECLLIQLIQEGKENSLAAKIVKEHLERLLKKNSASLAKALKAPETKIREAIELIHNLEPKPGRLFWKKSPQGRIVIDLVVKKSKEGFDVSLADAKLPELKFNPFYISLLKDRGLDASCREFLEKKYKRAFWLIRAIEERKTTLEKMGQCVVRHQQDFLESGSPIRVLTLKDVAKTIGRHVSTVSRAIKDKYIQTPRGVFELKYFLSRGLLRKTSSISSRNAQETLVDLIAQENHKEPLSDQKLHQILLAQGIPIARRTVTKYREKLKILPSNLRTRQFSA